MAVSNVNDTYSKVISSITSNITRVVDNTKDSSGSNTGNSSLTDTLELNSSISDLSAYLNYGSSGKYSSLSLADFLNNNSDSEDNNLFSLLGTDNASELSSIEDSSGSSDSMYQFDNDSISSTFQEMADAKTKEIDDLISKTLSKLNNTEKDG